MSHRTAAAAEARRLLALPNAVIFDSETTDLSGYFVQVCILNLNGDVLLNTLINPCESISSGARRIHGISDEQVIGAPTFADLEVRLRELLHDKDVIVYNVNFDRGIVENEVTRLEKGRFVKQGEGDTPYGRAMAWVRQSRWHCAMELYAQWVGQRRYGSYRWQPLPGGDHSAAGDCRATLAVLKRMAESE